MKMHLFVLFLFTNLLKIYAVEENFEETPILNSKRSALLLDRILVALQEALADNEDEAPANNRPSGTKTETLGSGVYSGPASEYSKAIKKPQARISPGNMNAIDIRRLSYRRTGLQRRDESTSLANQRGNVWKCYFNAVTCFKK